MPEDESRSLKIREEEDDLLSPYPALAGGFRIGYARVSTREQNLARQERALRQAGCSKIFSDKLSGRNADRAGLKDCMEYARPGDTIVVLELSRFGRSLQDLINLVGQLRRNSVGFMSIKEHIDTTTPGGRLVFHIFASLAEFIRELIVDGTNEGIAAARAAGKQLGRPAALTPDQIAAAVQLLASPTTTVTSIAKLLGGSRTTLYRHIPGLRGPAAISQ